MIKTSDSQRQFSTGAVRDNSTGKGRMDLLPWLAILDLSKHCENGSIHYGEHNVDRGLPMSVLLDSGTRHAAKFIAGEVDEDHLLAAAWNFMWAVQIRRTHPELVDVPWQPPTE